MRTNHHHDDPRWIKNACFIAGLCIGAVILLFVWAFTRPAPAEAKTPSSLTAVAHEPQSHKGKVCRGVTYKVSRTGRKFAVRHYEGPCPLVIVLPAPIVNNITVNNVNNSVTETSVVTNIVDPPDYQIGAPANVLVPPSSCTYPPSGNSPGTGAGLVETRGGAGGPPPGNNIPC